VRFAESSGILVWIENNWGWMGIHCSLELRKHHVSNLHRQGQAGRTHPSLKIRRPTWITSFQQAALEERRVFAKSEILPSFR